MPLDSFHQRWIQLHNDHQQHEEHGDEHGEIHQAWSESPFPPEPLIDEERMRTIRIGIGALLIVLSANANSAPASERENRGMNELAKARGGYLCHSPTSGKQGTQETLPVGLAWKDVAKRYKGHADAEDRLTRIVLQGSGSNLSNRHWNGKAQGAGMLPNAVEINEDEARRLVRWILSFGK